MVNDSGRPLSYHNFTDKKAKWLLKEAVFFLNFFIFYLYFFFVILDLHLPPFKVRGFTNDCKFCIMAINITSRHSNLNFAHHFVIN